MRTLIAACIFVLMLALGGWLLSSRPTPANACVALPPATGALSFEALCEDLRRHPENWTLAHSEEDRGVRHSMFRHNKTGQTLNVSD